MSDQDHLVEHLASAAAAAFFEAAGEPFAWTSTPEQKRATFRKVARAALGAARQYRRMGVADPSRMLGRVVSDAFLDRDDCPGWLRHRYDWNTGLDRDGARPVFLAMAQAIIAAGREAKAKAAA
jgi:hypothetical protein